MQRCQFRYLLPRVLLPLCLGLQPLAAVAGESASPVAQSSLNVAAFDVMGGGSREGHWATGIQAGFPWQAVHVQYGLKDGWTPFVEVDSALLRRTQPSIGMALRWVDKPRFRLTGEALVGWQHQAGILPHSGPSLALRLRAAWVGRHILPYTAWTTRHTLLIDQTVLETASGSESTLTAQHRWDALAVVGMVIALGPQVGLELGLEYPYIDGSAVTLPGFHLGLQFGGKP